MKIIGLTGLAGSGKDTVRSYLQEQHAFAGMAFADPIRSMLAALLREVGASEDWMTDRLLKEGTIPALGTSYRHLAQTLGTEWGRSVNPEFWLRIAQARLEVMREAGVKCVVISDVRFLNEAHWISSEGGQVWRIDRPQAEAVRPHQSELISHITPHRIIPNSGTLADLHRWVDAIFWDR